METRALANQPLTRIFKKSIFSDPGRELRGLSCPSNILENCISTSSASTREHNESSRVRARTPARSVLHPRAQS
jgi:hypothetical protein